MVSAENDGWSIGNGLVAGIGLYFVEHTIVGSASNFPFEDSFNEQSLGGNGDSKRV